MDCAATTEFQHVRYDLPAICLDSSHGGREYASAKCGLPEGIVTLALRGSAAGTPTSEAIRVSADLGPTPSPSLILTEEETPGDLIRGAFLGGMLSVPLWALGIKGALAIAAVIL